MITHISTYKQTGCFAGEAGNPLLAPRGAFFCNGKLVVSDTGQNRVFIWHNFNFTENLPASVLLGTGTETVNAASLQYPSGIWTSGEKLVVADAWNHRVLVWHRFPQKQQQPADVVIGQPGFTQNQPNVNGLGSACSAQTLYWPYGVYSNGRELWIADTGNRRVLYFETIPENNFCAATAVIGQENFAERDFNNENAVWPYSVKVSETGSMLIADTQFYRVLYWPQWQQALKEPAPVIIGQPDLQSSGQNQFRLTPSAHTLNWCYDACFYGTGIAIADTGNSRILLHAEMPETSNAAATQLIGQPHFEVNGESSLSLKTAIANEMYWPFAVNADGDTLVVTDTGNHRILFYQPS